jgi:hypothetical protein
MLGFSSVGLLFLVVGLHSAQPYAAPFPEGKKSSLIIKYQSNRVETCQNRKILGICLWQICFEVKWRAGVLKNGKKEIVVNFYGHKFFLQSKGAILSLYC